MAEQDNKIHPYVPKLVEQVKAGKIDRREFLWSATLLGLSASSAYGVLGLADPMVRPAAAQTSGAGSIYRIAMRVPALENPATYSWAYDSLSARLVCDYLTRTGADNVTRPWLCEKWDATEDLKTWTLHLKQGVKWSNGDPFVADHVIWNIKRWIDPKVGSSILGLMAAYMTVEVESGEKDASGKPKMTKKMWDANAIEKVDDHTVRLNCRVPQLAVPEHLFHYPALILHPSENGKFGKGSIGTAPYSMVEYEVGKKVVAKRRDGYWGKPVAIETIEVIDLGDDPGATIAALAAKQVDGMYDADIAQVGVLKQMDRLKMYEVTSAQTAVARMQPTHDEWKDPRIRKAMRLALDTNKLLQLAYQGLGAPGEHHHAAPVQPDYYKLPFVAQDIPAAKKLLADAGKPNGFKTEIYCKKDPNWESVCVQAMAEMWKQIGVEVKVNVLPSTQYWDIWNAPTAPFAFTPWTHRPLGVMLYGLAYRTGAVWNESFWSNKEFDENLTKAEGLLEVEKRKEVMKVLEQIMLDDGPICLPLYRGIVTFHDKKLKGFQAHPTSYWFAEDWSLET
ncbi:MAG: ABC transporter substrate-binding protein [Alphaproteobacteria bacterium]|nr:ABC transporter substrate-binding protein [Alphaproteobacteria bacterium]